MKETLNVIFATKWSRGYFNGWLLLSNLSRLILILGFLPNENYQSIQDLIYILERELYQREQDILEFPLYVAKKRLKQLLEEAKRKEEENKKQASNVSKPKTRH
jgi:hypothetical protein